MSAKTIIFDIFYYSYSYVVAVYLTYKLAISATLIQEFPQEWFIQNISTLSLSLVILSILSSLTSVLFFRFQIPTLGIILFSKITTITSVFRSFWGLHLLATFLMSVMVSLIITQVSIYELTDPEGFNGAVRLFKGLLHANLTILPTAISGVVETIYMAFLSTISAAPFAFALSFACSKNLMKRPLAFTTYAFLRTILNVTRSIEPVIWALIFTVWVGIGPFAGMLALFIHSIASLTKQYSEIVEDITEGQLEGVRSTGANTFQTVWFAIVPQITLPYIAFTIYRWDINVRMATVIGLVGGGGIGNLFVRYQGQAMWPEVGCIIIVIATVVWLLDVGSAYLRDAIK
jgi:phosphonate transport system permease protein